jgi:hypothetical protein
MVEEVMVSAVRNGRDHGRGWEGERVLPGGRLRRRAAAKMIVHQ